MVRYMGSRSGPDAVLVTVLRDGRMNVLYPLASQRVWNHSPDGFNWGYGGSGPAQLALAILLDYTKDKEFVGRHYQEFKRQVVAGFGDRWELSGEQIEQWIEQWRQD